VARFSTPRETFRRRDLSRVRTPTLILWGEGDALIAVEGGRWFARGIPGSTLVTYPGIGHLPQEEAPEQTLRDLRGWLATLDGSRKPTRDR
jgi:pimeloyl-ACP methyl ester carboxylesterase